jgi:hypothetical protein
VVQHDPAVSPHADHVAGPSRVVAEVLAVAEQLVVRDGFIWSLGEAVLFFNADCFAKCTVVNEAGISDKHTAADLIAPILKTANIVRLSVE